MTFEFMIGSMGFDSVEASTSKEAMPRKRSTSEDRFPSRAGFPKWVQSQKKWIPRVEGWELDMILSVRQNNP